MKAAPIADSFGNPAPTTKSPKPRKPTTKRPPNRADLPAGVVYGRSGEVLTRNRMAGDGYVNEFDIPADAMEPGWDLYWARASCHGKPDNANLNALHDNGWRPASPENYKRVMPDLGKRATIERDGLILMERPMELTHRSLAEDREEAINLRTIQAEAFGDRKLPKGFDKGRRASKGNFDASKKIARGEFYEAPKSLKPEYAYAGPGDDD